MQIVFAVQGREWLSTPNPIPPPKKILFKYSSLFFSFFKYFYEFGVKIGIPPTKQNQSIQGAHV